MESYMFLLKFNAGGITMNWEDIVKEERMTENINSEIKEALQELLFDGERKEKITVSREFLHMIWRMLD